jgi:hypothetical protein
MVCGKKNFNAKENFNVEHFLLHNVKRSRVPTILSYFKVIKIERNMFFRFEMRLEIIVISIFLYPPFLDYEIMNCFYRSRKQPVSSHHRLILLIIEPLFRLRKLSMVWGGV